MRLRFDRRMGDEIGHCSFGAGFDLWIVPRSDHRQKAAALRVDYGSVDLNIRSTDGQRVWSTPLGTAHFLEHRLFDKACGDITDRFNALGGDVNASTSYTNTVFTLACAEHFNANLELLFELVFDFNLPAGSVEREREIIARELCSGHDDPEWMGYLRGMQCLYGDVPLSHDMAGTLESLGQIDGEAIALCHQAFYRPERMGLFLCGDIEVDAAIASVASCLDRYRVPDAGYVGCDRSVVRSEGQRSVEIALPIQRPYALWFYGDVAVGMSGRALLERELALELALDIAFGPASDFYAAHYEGGLVAGDAFGAEVYAEPSYCFCAIGGYTQHGERLGEAIAATLELLPDVVEADFSRAKRKAYGQLLRACEQAEQVTDLLCAAAIGQAELGEYFDVYEQIEAAAVLAAWSDCLRPEQMASVIIQPKSGA